MTVPNPVNSLYERCEGQAAETARARDFVRRFADGPRDLGYETSESIAILNEVLPLATAEQVQRAVQLSLEDLSGNQLDDCGIGKVALSGIAAYLARELLDSDR